MFLYGKKPLERLEDSISFKAGSSRLKIILKEISLKWVFHSTYFKRNSQNKSYVHTLFTKSVSYTHLDVYKRQ